MTTDDEDALAAFEAGSARDSDGLESEAAPGLALLDGDLAPHLPRYQRSMLAYAEELPERIANGDQQAHNTKDH